MKKLICSFLVVLLVSSFGTFLATVSKAEENVENIYIQPEIVPEITVGEFIPIPPPLIIGTITITEGWNLIAMPVLPDKPYTVRQFIADVESGFERDPLLEPKDDVTMQEEQLEIPIRIKEWEVKVLAVYKNGRFERYPKKGITYNMVPGEAYFVYAEYNGLRPLYPVDKDGKFLPWYPRKSIKISGRPLHAPVSLNLNRGWNGVSVMQLCNLDYTEPWPIPLPQPEPPDITLDREPECVEAFRIITSLRSLSRELVEQGIKATKIAFWSAETQEWVEFALPLEAFKTLDGGVDFYPRDNYLVLFDRLIKPDEGFFLLCEENGLFIPGLPYPPKPPVERVRYTGRIEGVYYIPEEKPPYNYRLIQGNDHTNPQIPLKGVNTDMEERLSEAAQDGGQYTVEGVMIDIPYPTILSPYTKTARVLLVDKVYPAERVCYTGRIACIGWIWERPPYTFMLVMLNRDGSEVHIPLKGINNEVEGLLGNAAQDDRCYTVEGYMTVMMNYNGLPDGSPGRPVEVLLVDRVTPVYDGIILHQE